jgi:uncharacterized protein
MTLIFGARWHLLWNVLLFFSCVLLPHQAHSLDVPPHTRQVIDLAHVLSPEEQQQIESSLVRFQQEHGPQIQVLTIPSLEGETIESYSIKVVDSWKLGDEKRDDGLLLLLALQDRQTRIEVGQGLEGTLPDILAGRIVRDVMIPYFKEGRYDAGIVAGLNAIASRLGGTLKDAPTFAPAQAKPRTQSTSLSSLLFLFILFFVILPRLFGGRGRRGGRRDPEGLITGMILGGLLGSAKRRHRGGDGFGKWGDGGGFGGGGGGGFSGGGASGKW